MNFYLSSYELGNATAKLTALVPKGRLGYIPNARDFSGADQERRAKRIDAEMASLRDLGLDVELVNLRDYFDRSDALKSKLDALSAIFISGGNFFVLRQAMKLSGLDDILRSLRDSSVFLYAGYSAAGCVLAANLKVYEIVDPIDTPYPELMEVVWDGLGLVDFAFMPHWDSDRSHFPAFHFARHGLHSPSPDAATRSSQHSRPTVRMIAHH